MILVANCTQRMIEPTTPLRVMRGGAWLDLDARDVRSGDLVGSACGPWCTCEADCRRGIHQLHAVTTVNDDN